MAPVGGATGGDPGGWLCSGNHHKGPKEGSQPPDPPTKKPSKQFRDRHPSPVTWKSLLMEGRLDCDSPPPPSICDCTLSTIPLATIPNLPCDSDGMDLSWEGLPSPHLGTETRCECCDIVESSFGGMRHTARVERLGGGGRTLLAPPVLGLLQIVLSMGSRGTRGFGSNPIQGDNG